MSLLTLNEDVVRAIVSFLQADDARSLSRTGHSIHLVAKQQALLMTKVFLDSPHKLRGFCLYVLSDASNLMHCIRDITVFCGAFPVRRPSRRQVEYNERNFEQLPLLADVFEQAFRLEVLYLFDSEEVLEAEPRIRHAVTALRSLRVVAFFDAQDRAIDTVNAFRSSPEKLVLSFHPGLSLSADAPASASMLFDRLIPVQNVGSLELRSLSTSHLISHSAATRNKHMYGPPQWPHVYHVSIRDSWLPLALFLDAFPVLRELHLYNFSLVDTQGAMPWKALQRLKVYWGSHDTSPILQYDKVTGVLERTSFRVRDPGMWNYIKPEIMPTTLNISLYIQDGHAVREYLVPGTRVLHLSTILRTSRSLIHYHRDGHYDSDSDTDNEFDPIMEFFDFILVGKFQPSESTLLCATINFPDSKLHHRQDSYRVCDEFFDFFPSLRALAVSWNSEDCMWYRVVEVEERPELEEIPQEVGVRIRKYLSSTDPDTLRVLDDLPSHLFE